MITRSWQRRCVSALSRLLVAVAFIASALSGALSIGEKARPQAALYIARMPTAAELVARDTRAKYEPASGCYLGGYIEFDRNITRRVRDYDGALRRDPAEFEEIVRKPHAMYFFYIGYGKQAPLGWIQWLAERGKFVHIAMEPNDGLDRVRDDAYLRGFADSLAKTRARIFLRFGSEMNGDWTNYHNPAEYKKKFRLVHDIMRQRAPNVAMVWCPYAMPVRNIPDYYPGDDATDWVGVNMYSVMYHDNNLKSPCEYEHPNDLLNAVYSRYAARKPMMICEFGATHYSDCEGQNRPDFAIRKISTLYAALPRLFPRIKAINYFDLSADKVHNNYSVTDDRSVLSSYRYAISTPYFLSGAIPSRPPAGSPIALRVRKGEILRGSVEFSCFARTPSDIVTVTYRLDGIVIYKASRPDDWVCRWNAGSVKPGSHMLSLEAADTATGKVVASDRVQVVTAH